MLNFLRKKERVALDIVKANWLTALADIKISLGVQ